MKSRISQQPINRRHCLALLASALSACGGGGINLAALPGTGGTGIVAEGSISGFGSVILNGIKFDDTQASAAGAVLVDGASVTSAELRLGMVAAVRGERSLAAPTTGTATSIEVWSVARGTVSDLSDLSVSKLAGTFNVAEMKIRTTANTVLEGINASTPWAVACLWWCGACKPQPTQAPGLQRAWQGLPRRQTGCSAAWSNWKTTVFI